MIEFISALGYWEQWALVGGLLAFAALIVVLVQNRPENREAALLRMGVVIAPFALLFVFMTIARCGAEHSGAWNRLDRQEHLMMDRIGEIQRDNTEAYLRDRIKTLCQALTGIKTPADTRPLCPDQEHESK